MRLFRFLGRLVRSLWLGLNTIRKVLHLLLLLLVFGLVLAALVGQPVAVPTSGALVVDPTGELVEQLSGSPLDRALAEVDGTQLEETLLRDVTDSLEHAATDDRITAVVLQLDGLGGGGLAKLQAIGTALATVRAAGKKIYAVGGGFTRDQYYLAAHADEVIMHPLGLVFLEGYGYYRTYFKSAIDKLYVDLNVFRIGEYKSFVEPFIRDDMSAEDREASERWVRALWAAWERDVAKARRIDAPALDAYAMQFAARLEAAGGDAAQAAVDAKLVDRLMTRPEITDYLIEQVGESEFEDGVYSGIDFRSYVRATRMEERLRSGGDREVAVVVAAGNIVDGEAAPGTAGGDTVAAELREAANDDAVAAVVIRVDSPGGSMFASDVIYNEITALRAAGKPVVASMSAVAASGGYYISMLADEVWASETTITGSIGVGALFPTVQRTLDRLGVHVDGWGTTPLAGELRPDRVLGEEGRRVLTASVADAYETFVDKVADSRDIPFERADSIARGRVWIGSDAKDLGLVDQLGELDGAIASAAALAGLAEDGYRVRYMQPDLSLAEQVMAGVGARLVRLGRTLGLLDAATPGDPVTRMVRDFRTRLEGFADFNDPRGLYLHCFCQVY